MKPYVMSLKAGLLLSAMALTSALPAQAQTGQTRRLVDGEKILELLVERGVISQADADVIVSQAEVVPVQPATPAGGVHNGVQTIPYVPQVVRDEIKAELRAELGEKASVEGWAKPGETPEWTKRISFYGDVRLRAEGRFADSSNYTDFPDWNAINSGSGWQSNKDAYTGKENPPYLNTTEDRQRLQVRARVGLHAKLSDLVSADIRLATGSDNSPVTTNQTLGGSGTSKYHVWVDRAALSLTPVEGVAIDLGRFGNPFWTSDLIFDNDLNFDGLAVRAATNLSGQTAVFGTFGAFPVYNTSLNFSSNDVGAFESTDKYLVALQAGLDWVPTDRLKARVAAGYFYYDGVQGEFSSPALFNQDTFDTDATRPSFQQFGNTMRTLRNILPDTSVPSGTTPEVQYYGLASKFEILNVRAQFDYDLRNGRWLRFDADYVKNFGFDKRNVAPYALNNYEAIVDITAVGRIANGAYDGGDQGWQARFSLGKANLGLVEGNWSAERGDWSTYLGYRHLESDAVIDGFADSDFGLGGTNVKGWFIGGNYAYDRNSYVGFRWVASEEVTGPPLSFDRLFIDIGSKF